MHVRLMGTRQGESKNSHFVSLLVDDFIALDAGCITSALTLQEQSAVQHILLTHRHYDHIKDLATFGFNRLGRGQVGIYCTPEVRAVVEATILSNDIWLNFFALPTPEMPTFIHTPVQPGQSLTIAGYKVRPVTVTHSVPALGYAVTSPNGGTLLYSGDSGSGSGGAWASTMPDLLIVEVTYPDARMGLALRYGHLSPGMLENELRTFQAICGKLPEIAVIHVNPYYEAEIANEVAIVAQRLSANISLPDEGLVINVDMRTFVDGHTNRDMA